MRSSLSIACALMVGVGAMASMNGACSADSEASASSKGSGSGQGGAATMGTASGGSTGSNPAGGGDILISTGNGTGGAADPDAGCAASTAEATLKKKPVDIIFMIDNSGSMSQEITGVQTNINTNFATIIGASGIDYRVIMIAKHGNVSGQDICVSSPLSTTNCMPIPAQPANNPPIFYHYSRETDSHNSVCQMYGAYDGTFTDQFNLHPNGWSEWLRPEAFKVFVEITDDGMGNAACLMGGTIIDDNDNVADGTTSAANFDAAMLALAPLQFGDANKRNYIFHSLIGVAPKATPTEAYQPNEPIATGRCSAGGTLAPAAGTGYQALSILTGGLRFPVCDGAGFDVVFQEIAKGVIEGSKVECEIPVPEPPPGETLDLATVVVEYTPGNMGSPVKLKQVANLAACGTDNFYIENKIIKICPQSCGVIQADDGAKLIVVYGCEPEVT